MLECEIGDGEQMTAWSGIASYRDEIHRYISMDWFCEFEMFYIIKKAQTVTLQDTENPLHHAWPAGSICSEKSKINLRTTQWTVTAMKKIFQRLFSNMLSFYSILAVFGIFLV